MRRLGPNEEPEDVAHQFLRGVWHGISWFCVAYAAADFIAFIASKVCK